MSLFSCPAREAVVDRIALENPCLISDLHLSADEPFHVECFERFLRTKANGYSELVILGDFFDYWVGDDAIGTVKAIVDALSAFAQTHKVFVMHGNRDFMLGNRFAQTCGATLLADPCVATVGNETVLLSHGDIWTLGRHRLICGDSTKEETYTALMDGRKANLVITDPPYNVNYEGSAGKIKNDNMASEKFFDFLFDAFSNMEKVMADDASIYVFHADTEGLNFRKAFDAAGFYLSGCCIWKKQSLVLGRSPYQWQHEPCLYGWKKKGKHRWYTGRKESTIWEFDKPKKNGDHPTMKPIPLLAYPIQNSSMANSVVLDPFGGSGSTLIACEQTDRICCTIELDEKFCDVIVHRYIEQVGSDEKVSVLRDGKEYKFSEVAPHEE